MANTPGKGTVLQISIAAVFTTIAQNVTITPLSATNPEIDVTTLTDTARKFIASIPDYGTVQFEGNYSAAETTHTKLFTDFAAGTEGSYKIVFADAGLAEMAFNAVITSLDLGEAAVDSVVKISGTLKISGAATITP